MNPNRQSNCCPNPAGVAFTGRPGCRPAMPVSQLPCCSDVAAGGVIVGSFNRGCDKETVLTGLPVAMAYVPWQAYGNLYPVPQALRNGTLFQELNLDFAGRRCN